MCRNIRTLYNFDPPATAEEVARRRAPVRPQDQRFTKPSQANEEAFDRAVEAVRRDRSSCWPIS